MTTYVDVQDVERFRRFVTEHFGFTLEEHRLVALADLLREQIQKSRLSASAYLDRLATERGEADLKVLAIALTIPETYFFRAPAQLDAFRDVAAPTRAKGRGTLRILSAGCASGEEPYTLGILVREAGLDRTHDVRITGVDINPAMLAKARRGRFTPWSLRETSPAQRSRWFTAEGNEHVIDPSVRALVTFEERNLTSARESTWPDASFDIVFWRNVMMYFTPNRAIAALERLTNALAPGGYLFLGHAETLRGVTHDYHLCHTHGTFYYQRHQTLESRSEAMPESWPDAIDRSTARVAALVTPPAPVVAPPAAPAPDALAEALSLLEKERFAEALERLTGVPDEPYVLLLRAALLTHAGQLTDAERACERLLELDELDAGAHYLLALCCEGAGDRRAATDHDQIAVYLDPAFAMPRLHLGLLSRRNNEREAARRELGQALVLLQHEDPARVRLFGGGFTRDALISLCKGELVACGGTP